MVYRTCLRVHVCMCRCTCTWDEHVCVPLPCELVIENLDCKIKVWMIGGCLEQNAIFGTWLQYWDPRILKRPQFLEVG